MPESSGQSASVKLPHMKSSQASPTQGEFNTYPVWKPSRVLVGVLGVAIVMTALGMMVLSIFVGPSPLWNFAAFEAITLAAGILAVLVAFGRFAEAPGLALLCIAGTVFGSSVLAFMSVGQVLYVSGSGEPMSLREYVLIRAAIAGVIGGIAVLTVLGRNASARTTAIKAFATWIPVVLGVIAVWKRGVIEDAMASMPSWIAPTAAILGGMLFVAFLCAGVHLTIRAFELGRAQNENNSVA